MHISLRPTKRHPPIEDEKESTTNDSPSPTSVGYRQSGILEDGTETARPNFSEERTLTENTPTRRDFESNNGRTVDIRKATKTRRHMIVTASIFFFISVIFLILTIIGNTHPKAVLRSTYFFKINISNIIPTTAGDAILVNSLARSLGLHDFYQVGLFNFCEGYDSSGLTGCSHPSVKYWFNPISIILDELLPGSTISLPAEVVSILSLVRIASNIMTAFFITGCVLNTVCVLITPVVVLSRWWSGFMGIFSFIAALLTTAASIIATVMFIIFKNALTSQPGLNIKAALGTQMFVFMWFGAAFSILGWGINAGMCCCCASERDVRTGRRAGNKEGWPGGVIPEGVGKKKKKHGDGEGKGKWKIVGEKGTEVARKLPTVFKRRKAGSGDV